MEFSQANISSTFGAHTVSVDPNQLVRASAAGDHDSASRVDFHSDLIVGSFDNKKQSNPSNQVVQGSFTRQSAGVGPTVHIPTSTPGVSNCYVFKSQLQEYAQKVGLPTPVYETIKQGPSHEPSFRSTVIVNGERYDSLPGFFNRKAAEQSAAEIALMELSKGSDNKQSITVPVHETGLCKNLLQEYAQKMNYAIPTYICRKDDAPGRTSLYSCTVDIGGIQYIGATARTKKDAEIKAARTALLAIRSNPNVGGQDIRDIQYTVVPCKRKVSEIAPPQVETVKLKKRNKPKKPRFKKKSHKQRDPGEAGEQIQAGNMGTQAAPEQIQNGVSDVEVPHNGQALLACSGQVNGSSNINQIQGEVFAGAGDPVPQVCVNYDSSQFSASSCQLHSDRNTGSADSIGPFTDGNRDPAIRHVPRPPMIIDPPISGQMDALVSDSRIVQPEPSQVVADGQAEPLPAIADINHARVEDPPVANGA